MMTLLSLPTELLDTILSYLAVEGEKASLQSCSRTCKRLLPLSQTYHFFVVRVKGRSAASFYEHILTKRHHICRFIRHLYFIENYSPWIQKSESAHALFHLLSPYVTSFHILQRGHDDTTPRFDLSPISTLKNLVTITLTEKVFGSKQIVGGGDPALPIFLNQHPRLRAITFRLCMNCNELPAKSLIPPPTFALDALDIDFCFDHVVLKWLLPALSTLQTFYFSMEDAASGTNSFAKEIVRASGVALRHIELRGIDEGNENELHLIMTQVRHCNLNLRSIKFGLNTAVDPMGLLLRFLNNLEMHPSLRTVTIVCRQEQALGLRECEKLQELLLGPSFPCFDLFFIHLLQESQESLHVAPEPYVASYTQFAARRMLSIKAISTEDSHRFMAGTRGSMGCYLPQPL